MHIRGIAETETMAANPVAARVEPRRHDAKWGVPLRAHRVWAIGAIHADAARLSGLHDTLADRILPNDSVAYLGNYIGHGEALHETLAELLTFRRAFLSRQRFVHPTDLVYLRGQQEEMWQKLLQLQFAVDPEKVLRWMLQQGVDATLAAYGGHAPEAVSAARSGPLALARWAETLRGRMRQAPGHIAFFNSLYRTAWISPGDILFVHAGFDPGRPFVEQTDEFWWDTRGFESRTAAFDRFRRVVRGYDPRHGGVKETQFTVSLDGGCGFGGDLVAACLDSTGAILDRIST